MKWALISPNEDNRVAQVADTIKDTFEVAPPLKWIQCPDDVVADRYTYDGTTFTPKG